MQNSEFLKKIGIWGENRSTNLIPSWYFCRLPSLRITSCNRKISKGGGGCAWLAFHPTSFPKPMTSLIKHYPTRKPRKEFFARDKCKRIKLREVTKNKQCYFLYSLYCDYIREKTFWATSLGGDEHNLKFLGFSEVKLNWNQYGGKEWIKTAALNMGNVNRLKAWYVYSSLWSWSLFDKNASMKLHCSPQFTGISRVPVSPPSFLFL